MAQKLLSPLGLKWKAPILVAAMILITSLAKGGEPTELPRPQAWVSDLAGVIDASSEARLNQYLGELKRKTGAEVAVVTLKSLEGDSIERFAASLFETWGIGERGKDNGILILLTLEEREVKIEVGYGLEGIIPDGLAGEIIRTQMIPLFREGDYGTGLLRGVATVAQTIANEAGVSLTPPAGVRIAPVTQRPPKSLNLLKLLLLLLLLPVLIRHPWLLLFFLGGRGGGMGRGGFGMGGGFGGFGGGLSGGGGAVGRW